ncbi:MAG: response regulator [Candidatus Omnitrophota bacterium]
MVHTILLVDDEADFLRVMSVELKNAGYKVVTAHNGREAVGAYVESLYKGYHISLIIQDMKLPDLDGIEVLQIIRREEEVRGTEEGRLVPVIMLTGYDRPWMDPLMIKGCNNYMVKSGSSRELLEKIGEILPNK